MRKYPELRDEMFTQQRRCEELEDHDTTMVENELENNPYFGLQPHKPVMQSITY